MFPAFLTPIWNGLTRFKSFQHIVTMHGMRCIFVPFIRGISFKLTVARPLLWYLSISAQYKATNCWTLPRIYKSSSVTSKIQNTFSKAHIISNNIIYHTCFCSWCTTPQQELKICLLVPPAGLVWSLLCFFLLFFGLLIWTCLEIKVLTIKHIFHRKGMNSSWKILQARIYGQYSCLNFQIFNFKWDINYSTPRSI